MKVTVCTRTDLRDVRKQYGFEVEAEHGMDAGAVCGGDELRGRVAGQLEQCPQPARTGRLADDAEQNAQVMTDDQRSTGVTPAVVVRQTRFLHDPLTLLLLQ